MTNFDDLLQILAPVPKPFLPTSQFHVVKPPSTLKARIETQLKRQYQQQNLTIVPVDSRVQWSLYASLLCLLYPPYHLLGTHDDRQSLLQDLQQALNHKIKILTNNSKSKSMSPSKHMYLLSKILGLNIVVFTKSGVELYDVDACYDDCQPHILLHRDDQHTYAPMVCEGHDSDHGQSQYPHLLNYHDHAIIRDVVNDRQKKVYKEGMTK